MITSCLFCYLSLVWLWEHNTTKQEYAFINKSFMNINFNTILAFTRITGLKKIWKLKSNFITWVLKVLLVSLTCGCLFSYDREAWGKGLRKSREYRISTIKGYVSGFLPSFFLQFFIPWYLISQYFSNSLTDSLSKRCKRRTFVKQRMFISTKCLENWC